MLSMPLVTIKNIKSGHYDAAAFEYLGKFYVGKHGLLPGFQGGFERYETETVEQAQAEGGIATPIRERDAWLNGFDVTPPLTDKISEGMNKVGGTSGNEPTHTRANGQAQFDSSMAGIRAGNLNGYAWWYWHLDFDVTDNGTVTQEYYDYDFIAIPATLEYLGRVDGAPYHFGSLGAAQKWIDINMTRDAQNKPKTGKALERKLAGLRGYYNKTQASLTRMAKRTYPDETTRLFVLNALNAEIAEINRRYLLESNGGA